MTRSDARLAPSGGVSALGSVEGVLAALNTAEPCTVTLRDRVTGADVRCTFPRDAA